MDKVKAIVNHIRKHLPSYIAVIIVVLAIVNNLVDSGLLVLPLSDGTVAFINAILSAAGLGVLHKRQGKN